MEQKSNKEKVALSEKNVLVEGKDIQVIQDTKILLHQILKAMPTDVRNQINVIMVNEISHGDSSERKIDFVDFLKSIPEPRLDNLKIMAIHAALSEFKTNREAAKFLGITPATLKPSYEFLEKEIKFNPEENGK